MVAAQSRPRGAAGRHGRAGGTLDRLKLDRSGRRERRTRGASMPRPNETLERVGLLRSLSREEREAFERRCEWRDCSAKQWLLEQNDVGTDIFFLTSGVVRVLITPSPDRE